MHPTLVVMFMDAQRSERQRQARNHRVFAGRSRTRTQRDQRR
ncbi:MAG: hypothetical protein ABW249_01990 [Solirubrobacterales bacterium]